MLEIDKNLQQTEPDCRAGLRNHSLILRTPGKRDLANFVALSKDPILTKNLCNYSLPTSLETAYNWLDNQTVKADDAPYYFALSNFKDEFYGQACLLPADKPHMLEMSIVLRRSVWNMGIATQAAQALVDFAFSNPNITNSNTETLLASCRVSCTRSRRMVEKCGFQYCGTGMARSPHYKGMIPIDRFHLDRGIWKAIRQWGQRHNHLHSLDQSMKGAA